MNSVHNLRYKLMVTDLVLVWFLLFYITNSFSLPLLLLLNSFSSFIYFFFFFFFRFRISQTSQHIFLPMLSVLCRSLFSFLIFKYYLFCNCLPCFFSLWLQVRKPIKQFTTVILFMSLSVSVFVCASVCQSTSLCEDSQTL